MTNASLQLKDRQAGLIVARTGFAFFGQEIKVSISCDMDHTHVSLFIRPKVNIAMIDFGTGLETIGRIEEYLLAL